MLNAVCCTEYAVGCVLYPSKGKRSGFRSGLLMNSPSVPDSNCVLISRKTVRQLILTGRSCSCGTLSNCTLPWSFLFPSFFFPSEIQPINVSQEQSFASLRTNMFGVLRALAIPQSVDVGPAAWEVSFRRETLFKLSLSASFLHRSATWLNCLFPQNWSFFFPLLFFFSFPFSNRSPYLKAWNVMW